jgi:ketosteroid isomerase-like protein
MSRENMDLVRSIFAAWERGDYSSAEWAHRDIEFVYADRPDPGSWKGLDAMAKANRNWLQAWEDVRQIAEEFRDIDDGRVLVLHHYRARGKKSGLDLGHMRGEGAAIFHLRGGKVMRLVHYFDRGRALEAVGLRE